MKQKSGTSECAKRGMAWISFNPAVVWRFSRFVVLASALAISSVSMAQSAARKLEGLGASGTFLAGVVANAGRDTTAAATYFREALKADPRNAALLDQSFLADLVDGNLLDAFKTADRSILRDKSNALAHVAIGVRALKAKEYRKARQSFERAGGAARNTDITVGLLRAWTFVGTGQIEDALALVDRFKEPELSGYREFFGGMMADIAKQPGEAEKRLENAYKSESGTLRVTEAYGRILSRRNKMEKAKAVFAEWQSRNPGQPYLDVQSATLAKGKPLEPLARDVAEGAAEVFYGLGAVGSASRDPLNAIIYMQFAHYLAPDDEVITMSLGEFFEQMRQNERSAQIYAGIPTTSPFANRAAIGRAGALERMEKSDEAISVLQELLKGHPDDIDAADTLGSILRVKKRWQESIAVYDAIIKQVPKLEHKHWALLFGRAIGFERIKQWPKAEADFQTALDLIPPKPRNPREKAERAQVLNYLAYSWVDMHMNIDKSFEMLREAVALTPNDGAIVDSLGWAFYRLGKYEDAVRELERAVLLRSGDSTINDHLGDAFWRVGRTREARFKWSQALDLKPEDDERPKIQKKLENGLEEAPAAAIVTPKPNGG